MKKAIVTILSLALMCAILAPVFASAQASLEPLSITSVFEYKEEYGDEGVATTPATFENNRAYMDMLNALIQDSDAVCQSETLYMTAKKVLATDDMTALVWQVTNMGDAPLYVQSSEFSVTFSGIDYDLCGGDNWDNYTINPGETLNARFQGVLSEHFAGDNGEFTISMKVYAGDRANFEAFDADEVSPEDAGMTLREEVNFTVPVDMQKSETRSALQNGEPLEKDFAGYTLRVTQADMNAVSTQFAYERIYATEAEARADSPIGDQFWEYAFESEDGSVWIRSAYGTIPDDPVQLEDGRWAWQLTNKVYFMFSQPNTVILQSQHYDGESYLPVAGESLALEFSKN